MKIRRRRNKIRVIAGLIFAAELFALGSLLFGSPFAGASGATNPAAISGVPTCGSTQCTVTWTVTVNNGSSGGVVLAELPAFGPLPHGSVDVPTTLTFTASQADGGSQTFLQTDIPCGTATASVDWLVGAAGADQYFDLPGSVTLGSCSTTPPTTSPTTTSTSTTTTTTTTAPPKSSPPPVTSSVTPAASSPAPTTSTTLPNITQEQQSVQQGTAVNGEPATGGNG